MKTIEDICPDFPEWPKRSMRIKEDVPYGQGILQAMRPFIESMISEGLSDRTIKRHLDNLWLIGGELIRDVSMNEQYDEISPSEKLQTSVGTDGGPYCSHLDSEAEMASYDSTCRKLYHYFEKNKKVQRR